MGIEPVDGGGQYGLQTINGNYLTAVEGGGKIDDAIYSDGRAIGPWERFTLVSQWPDLAPAVQYALQTVNCCYLTAVDGGGKLTDTVHTDATAIGPWERFVLVPVP